MPASSASSRRPYRQTRRAELAAGTRARIRDAARILLLENGWTGTSMRAVADGAGVGLRTVYDTYPTKTALLKDVVETAIVGDALAVPASGRDWFREVLDEADPGRRAALLARASARLHRRTAALFAVTRQAAAADPEVSELWKSGKAGHRSDCERFARAALAHRADGAAPDRRAVESLTTTLYVLIGPETYTLVTGELGLRPAAYERWLAGQLATVFGAAAATDPDTVG